MQQTGFSLNDTAPKQPYYQVWEGETDGRKKQLDMSHSRNIGGNVEQCAILYDVTY